MLQVIRTVEILDLQNVIVPVNMYSKTCFKQPLAKDHKLVFKTKNHPMGAFCNTFDLN